MLSNYGRPGDYLRIYEINPLVPGIAQGRFTFYPHSMADKEILMGDARLTLERQLADQQIKISTFSRWTRFRAMPFRSTC